MLHFGDVDINDEQLYIFAHRNTTIKPDAGGDHGGEDDASKSTKEDDSFGSNGCDVDHAQVRNRLGASAEQHRGSGKGSDRRSHARRHSRSVQSRADRKRANGCDRCSRSVSDR